MSSVRDARVDVWLAAVVCIAMATVMGHALASRRWGEAALFALVAVVYVVRLSQLAGVYCLRRLEEETD